MPKSFLSFVISSRNTILRRKSCPNDAHPSHSTWRVKGTSESQSHDHCDHDDPVGQDPKPCIAQRHPHCGALNSTDIAHVIAAKDELMPHQHHPSLTQTVTTEQMLHHAPTPQMELGVEAGDAAVSHITGMDSVVPSNSSDGLVRAPSPTLYVRCSLVIDQQSMMDYMKRLPELVQQKPSQLSILQVALNRRAQRAAVKADAERRVHLCEDHLKTLRQELSDAERELEVIERNVRDWQDYLSEGGSSIDASSTPVSGFPGFPNTTLSDTVADSNLSSQ